MPEDPYPGNDPYYLDQMEVDVQGGALPRVFVTDPDEPYEGRTFVWSKMGWLERIALEDGPAAFSPVAASEEELHALLTADERDALTEIDDDYAEHICKQFDQQNVLYPESPELSNQ